MNALTMLVAFLVALVQSNRLEKTSAWTAAATLSVKLRLRGNFGDCCLECRTLFANLLEKVFQKIREIVCKTSKSFNGDRRSYVGIMVHLIITIT